MARGITGTLIMLDGKTGKPRYTVDIEKAAGLTVEENRRDGPRFRKYRQTTVYAPSSAETAFPGNQVPETEAEAA